MSAMEEEIKLLKEKCDSMSPPVAKSDTNSQDSNPNTRDKTKYLLGGAKYGKNRLALAIVKEYLRRSPSISADVLMAIFDKSLQGSLGVIRTLEDAKESYADYEKRFFCKPNEIIRTRNKECVVCSQWGVSNINNIIIRARELGINVTIL